MKWIENIKRWWRQMFRRRRFNMLNATDNSEEWHIHISPASILSALLAFVLLMFIIILSLVAYSPVLELLPGYRTEADRSRESLMQNIIRVDSMERLISDMMTYNENITLVMEGHTPVVRMLANADSSKLSKVLVLPSREDSLLRAEMEGDGIYSLSRQEGAPTHRLREAIELTKPADGIITERFNIREGRMGVRIAPSGEHVAAIDNGTVVMNLWSPDGGSVVAVQHSANMLSIYKHLAKSLVAEGQTVRAGEQIGSAAESGTGDAKQIEFELWNNGKPVDPERYILF